MTALVAGEPADEIMAVLARADRGSSDDGLAPLSLTFQPDEVFVNRALMRLEAELLLEESCERRNSAAPVHSFCWSSAQQKRSIWVAASAPTGEQHGEV